MVTGKTIYVRRFVTQGGWLKVEEPSFRIAGNLWHDIIQAYLVILRRAVQKLMTTTMFAH